MTIAENLTKVRENIARAAKDAGRDERDILLIGATKMNDAARVREAIAAGSRPAAKTAFRSCWRKTHSAHMRARSCTSSAISSAIR